MSFDQYFEGSAKEQQQSQPSDDSDDWYGIVEQALYEADLASHRLQQQLELNLMKPLPIIPEDDNAAEDISILDGMYNHSHRPSSVYSNGATSHSKINRPDANPSVQKVGLRLQIPTKDTGSRRPSSVSHVEFDSPLSSESSALDNWASGICSTGETSMRSLRNKPFTRKSSSTGSAMSYRSASVGSSVMAGRPASRSSSVYSTDTSIGVHSRNVSTTSSREAEAAKCEAKPVGSFFEFSDDEEEMATVSAARRDSSASGYVRHLRKAALSFRLAASRRAAPKQAKMSSAPTTAEVSAVSAWLLRASLVGRIASSPASEEMEPEGQLMADAAESAKARRTPGMR